jgi:lipoprotein Spr
MDKMLKKTIIAFIFALTLGGCSSSKKTTESTTVITVYEEEEKAITKNLEKAPVIFEPIQLKYAKELNIDPSLITNVKLYSFIDSWMGTPYLWGGTTRRGIDCSAFVQEVLDKVYSINIPRTSNDQFFDNYTELFSSSKKLSEGDLVFFKTIPNNRPVSHVGMYLRKGIFINSSSSKGVSLGSLNDPYWSSKYVGAGRLKPAKAKQRS